MRQGYSKRKVKLLPASLSILCFLALASINEAAAQGGDGRPDDSPRKTSTRKSFKKFARATKQQTFRAIPPPQPARPKLGSLSAVINESDSRVYLSSTASSEPSLVLVTPRRQSAFWRMLPPGRYVLTVKKTGYFDEVRTVDMGHGGRQRLAISLRPQMAFLTLNSNVADADVEIERAGTFLGPLKKHLLKPGKYRLELRRRGYVSQTVTADLSVPGKEQNIYVVLKPLQIEVVLAQANALLSKGEFEGASLLVKDVLLLNAVHARANMLYGFIEMKRGSSSSAAYFLKAISGGETVSMPAKTVFADVLTDIQIVINRDAIAFQSTVRAELNFRIKRSNLEQPASWDENGSPSFVAVKGESDFYGKTIHPNLKIFSNASGMDASGRVICAAARTCAADAEVLFNVISRWREMGNITSGN